MSLLAQGGVVPSSGQSASTYYVNPHAGQILASFDRGADGQLYYSTGDAYWDLGFNVYQFNGTIANPIYSNPNAFAGSRVTAIGDNVYFNDGGDYSPRGYAYFKYSIGAGTISALNLQNNLGSLEVRNGNELWAAGGTPAAICATPLDVEGNPMSNPLVNLGTIGGNYGAMAFDTAGNLYYAEGYRPSGNSLIYKFSATEVQAALDDPVTTPLTPDGHEWVTVTGNFTGCTGMAFNTEGDLLVTTTKFLVPSELRAYHIDPYGANAGYSLLASGTGRLDTIRVFNETVYVSDADGIYSITPAPEPATLILFSLAGLLARRNQRED